MKKNKRLKKRLFLYIKKRLSSYRLEHVLNVQKIALILSKNILDRDLVSIMVYAHDMSKEFSYKRNLSIVKKFPYKEENQELLKKNIIHGLTAFFLLKEEFNFHNQLLLEANKYHTISYDNKDNLYYLCLYCADYMDPNKNNFTLEERKKLLQLNLLDLYRIINKKKKVRYE